MGSGACKATSLLGSCAGAPPAERLWLDGGDEVIDVTEVIGVAVPGGFDKLGGFIDGAAEFTPELS